MEGADDSITLARLSPPTGAATLDVRIGWVRNQSATNPDTLVSANPEGSLLYVDDLVVDAVAVATKAEPTISIARDGANLKITYVGTLEFSANVTGEWTPVAGATSPHPVTPSLPNIYYRTRR